MGRIDFAEEILDFGDGLVEVFGHLLAPDPVGVGIGLCVAQGFEQPAQIVGDSLGSSGGVGSLEVCGYALREEIAACNECHQVSFVRVVDLRESILNLWGKIRSEGLGTFGIGSDLSGDLDGGLDGVGG